jgi:signal transduction histidine kinase
MGGVSGLGVSTPWLGAPNFAHEGMGGEVVLATARVVAAIGLVLTIHLDPGPLVPHFESIRAVSVVYAAYSTVLLLTLQGRKDLSPACCWSVHTLDIFLPSVLSALAGSVCAPFFVLTLFVVMAAAYRWGLKESVETLTASLLLLLAAWALTLFAQRQAWPWLHEAIHLQRFGSQGTCLVVLGLVFGYLAENQRRFRRRLLAIAQIGAEVRPEGGFRESLAGSLQALLEVFSAKHVALTLQEDSSQRAFLWEAERNRGTPRTSVKFSEITPTQRQELFFSVPGDNWCAIWLGRARQGKPARCLGRSRSAPCLVVRFSKPGLEDRGIRLRSRACSFPETLFTRHQSRSLMGLSFALQDGWSGCLLLFDPSADSATEPELRFLHDLVRDVAPAIHSLYLLRGLRARAKAMERARVARELHDGAIQSVVAAEMEIAALRRQAISDPSRVAEDLERVQGQLHLEAINLREIIQQVRPLDLDPRQLLSSLADMVAMFRCETGIVARFVSDSEDVPLPPRVCREIGRIVQEALFNVRKHSGARQVLVRFVAEPGLTKLVIEDDGQGFEFSGRLSLAELDTAHWGPKVIKERVRSIGADLAIESVPGHGARLEITLA